MTRGGCMGAVMVLGGLACSSPSLRGDYQAAGGTGPGGGTSGRDAGAGGSVAAKDGGGPDSSTPPADAAGGAGGSVLDAAGLGGTGVDAGDDAPGPDGGMDQVRPGGCGNTGLLLGSPAVVPGAVALQGDFDGDGKPDLAGVGGLLLGNGDGTFRPAPMYQLSTSARALAAGDVNGDGKLDLVFANYFEYVTSPSSVSVLLGKGDGTFAPRTDYPAGNGAVSLALGDLDRDGDLDIVTANDLAGTVGVFLGQGSGAFAARQDYQAGSGALGPVIGDFDGDGKPDVAVFDRTADSVSLLPGRGDGTFATKVDWAAGADASSAQASLLAGDLNGDGKLDVVVATYLGAVRVLLGSGDGTFLATAGGIDARYVISAMLVDVDGDHHLDLVTALSDPAAVSLQLGRGDGTFALPRYYPSGGGDVGTAFAADVNGDGALDLVLSGTTVGVLLGTGAGDFATTVEYPVDAPPDALALGDLNGDRKLDLVTADVMTNAVSVLLGTGRGGFAAAGGQYPFGATTTLRVPGAVALGDLNGDGKLDLVTAQNGASAANVLLGVGDGTFIAPAVFPTGTPPDGLALGDVNGDGALDLVIASSADYAGTGNFNSSVSVLLGHRDGTFGAPRAFATGVDTHAVAIGDLDGDGNPDLVVANTGVDDYWSVGVLRGNGDGTFAKEVEFPSGIGPNSVALGDLNEDGKLDVVLANATAGDSVSVLLGEGDGTLAPQAEYLLDSGAASVTLADIDGDHHLDVVTAGGGVGVLFGKGDGTFPARLGFGAGGDTISVGDLNGDGRPDVVLPGYRSSVAVLLNVCP